MPPSREPRSARAPGTSLGRTANTGRGDRGVPARRASGGGHAPGTRAPTVASDGDEFAVLAPGEAKAVADLTNSRMGAHRFEDRGHEVALAAGGPFQAVHRAFPGLDRTLGADAPNPVDLAALTLRVDPLEGRRMDLVVAEAVDPDDDLVPGLDRLLDAVRGLLDLALLEAALDRGERPAHRLDLVEVAPRGGFELVRQALDVVRARQRVGGLGHPRLVREDLLGAQREPGGLLRRQRECLVAGVRVQALGATEHG